MPISLLGYLTIGLGVIGWLFSERLFIVTLAASSVFSTSAAVTISGNGIPPFDVIGTLATISAIFTAVGRRRTRHASTGVLIALVVWAALVTAVGPTLFHGMAILDPRSGIDNQIFDPTPLKYTPSMAAQIGYLIVGVGVAIYLSQRRNLSPWVVSVPMVVGTGLSALHMIPALAPTMDTIFRNSDSAGYLYYLGRAYGIFAEPSYLGVFSIAALAFSTYRLRAANKFERVLLVCTIVLSLVNLAESQSGAGALALVILGVLAIAYYGVRFMFLRMRLSPVWLVIPFGALVALITPNPLTDALSTIIGTKSDSLSFQHRYASDIFSLNLLRETFGVGVGLGANRPSSFATLVLSNIGIVGFVLMAVAFCVALSKARGTEWAPAAVALFALILVKVIAEPATSTPLLWFLLGVCMFAGRERDPVTDLSPVSGEREALRLVS